ncbi:MAG: 3-hydroxyacyl-CoA dehydrogenase family protein [Alphaproteobacteria bacterium]|jgi:3-hydroxybutyryl-CoA dehydrogenase
MRAPIHHVLVCGYGTMGRGIVNLFTRGGFRVSVLTRDPSKLTDLAEGATVVADLPADAPDLVMENYPEDLAVKQALFARLVAAYGAHPVLSSNTSGLDLTELAAPLANKQNFIGVHYLQPADAFPVAEAVRIPETSDETTAAMVDALKRVGQEAIVLNQPVVGFLFNRLQHALLHEAYHMLEEGLVSAEDIDKYARLAFGPRMCVTGIIEQKDVGGLDVNAASQRSIVPHLHHAAEPVQMVQDMAARGEHGVKTGKGFYDWSNTDMVEYRRIAKNKTDRILEIVRE